MERLFEETLAARTVGEEQQLQEHEEFLLDEIEKLNRDGECTLYVLDFGLGVARFCTHPRQHF